MKIHKGSILDCKVDAIVNPANSFLNHAGGLAGVISRAADPNPDLFTADQSVLDAARAWHHEHAAAGLVATGNAVLTSPGVLPFKGVIHAVGPIWNGGDYMEHDLLDTTYDSICRVAEKAGFESIAVPAISCGIFGFPVEEAAPIAVEVMQYTHIDVTFALVDPKHINAYERELSR